MYRKCLVFIVLFLTVPAVFGQYFYHAGLTSLKASEGEDGHAFAEVQLWWVPDSVDVEKGEALGNYGEEIGSYSTIFSQKMEGHLMEMESNRFSTREGRCFKDEDGNRFLELLIFYDRKSVDPTDDILVDRAIFPLEGDRAYEKACSEWEELQERPRGKPTYDL